MIRIITDRKKVKDLEDKEYKIVEMPWKRFERVLYLSGGTKNAEIKDIINTVEGCEVQGGDFISKFDGAQLSINSLSCGSKTCIYVYYRSRLNQDKHEIININQCGRNAMTYIFTNFSDCDLTLYTNQYEFPHDFELDFEFNGFLHHNTNELFNRNFDDDNIDDEGIDDNI